MSVFFCWSLDFLGRFFKRISGGREIIGEWKASPNRPVSVCSSCQFVHPSLSVCPSSQVNLCAHLVILSSSCQFVHLFFVCLSTPPVSLSVHLVTVT